MIDKTLISASEHISPMPLRTIHKQPNLQSLISLHTIYFSLRCADDDHKSLQMRNEHELSTNLVMAAYDFSHCFMVSFSRHCHPQSRAAAPHTPDAGDILHSGSARSP